MTGTLIIGWGNPLREDDGAGFRAAEALGGVSAHQLVLEMSFGIAQARRVVFVDADRSVPAGEWRVGHVAAEQASSITHHCTPGALLTIAVLLYGERPAEALLIRIGGQRWGYGEELSPLCAAAVDAVVNYVRAYTASSAATSCD